ncbi:MAG TPA: endonuclease domain-containing protein [Saprospiraceae bacterium]|nr:endonuclease domain-containing protein [Saprospiraceae bacterium]
MKTNMHHGAKGNIFASARQLRRHPTPAEEKLWEHLRNSQTGYKYRRQHPCLSYIVDFYCHALKLVIEVDGAIHEGKVNKLEDAQKQQDLEASGMTVIRYTNEEVLSNIDNVMTHIYSMQELLSNRMEL